MRSTVLGIVAIGLLLAAAGGALARWQRADPVVAAERDGGGEVGIAHPVYALDPEDDRALAAYATDIFVGRVVGLTGDAGAPTSAPGHEVPQTQFAVAVVRALKGRAAGVVTVNQVGGLDNQAHRQVLLEGDALLRSGATELFLVVAVPEQRWYQIVAGGYGHLPADDRARREELVERFARAAGAPPREDGASLARTATRGAEPMATAGATGASPDNGAQPEAAEPIDFVRFDGAVYLSSVYLADDHPSVHYRPLDARELGPVVGRVVTDRIDPTDPNAYPDEPCSWDSPDGTAPRLAVGDEIYAVRGYATSFRLAARRDGELVSYQVWCNDRAKVGADLFDIHARVERISVTGDLSESSGWAVIEDPATVAGLVAMLLAGRFVPEELASTAPVTHQLILHLDDGTTFRASAAPGEFLWGLGVIAVPAAFAEALDRAWAGGPSAAGPPAAGADAS